MPKITIVDEADNVIGAAERSAARSEGLRHRIVRIFVLNHDNMVLLHRRNPALTDSPNKWDQSAGGHVDEGEDYLAAAKRETYEELGITVDEFVSLGKFYIERPAPGGIVRRFQTVFTCKWDSEFVYDESEIVEVKWFSVDEIATWIQTDPDDFTKNFAAAFELLKQQLKASI